MIVIIQQWTHSTNVCATSSTHNFPFPHRCCHHTKAPNGVKGIISPIQSHCSLACAFKNTQIFPLSNQCCHHTKAPNAVASYLQYNLIALLHVPLKTLKDFLCLINVVTTPRPQTQWHHISNTISLLSCMCL